MASLDYAHRQTLALIEPQLNALYDKMSAALANGEDISASWIYEQNRLQAIEQYIRSYIDHFAALTQMQVYQLQSFGASLGTQAGMALLDSTVPKGISFAFGVPSPDAIANLVGATQKGSPLADLFSGFGAEAAQGAKDALISGLTLGYGPRQIAPGIQAALDISRNRALTIARDQLNDVYRSSNLETYRANSDVVSQWRWTCDLSPRSCAACIAEDGSLHDLDEEMDEHVCGRCTPVPITNSWDDILGPLGIDTSNIPDSNPALDMQTGSDWFDSQSADVQREILGNAKWDAWNNGDFTLDDIVGTNYDPNWGKSIYVKPLKELVK